MAKKLSGTEPVLIKQGVAFVPAIQAVVTLSKTAGNPSQSVEKIDVGGDTVAFWGENNDFPNKWELDVENDDTLRDAIEKTIDHLYGGGVECGYDAIDEMGEKTFVPYTNAEIDAFLAHPMTTFALEQLIRDYKIHGLPVPEVLIDRATNKAMVNALPAAHFRWAKQSPNGWIDWGYFNRNWPLGRKSNSPDTRTLAVLDPLVDTVELIKASKIKNYIFRVPLASHRTYYPLAPAYSAKSSNWLGIKAKTTKSFDASLDNQMSPKYHIEVDVEYMAQKYGERWKKATPEDINAMLMEELDHFHKMLHGPANTGKNIITTKWIEMQLKKEYSSWTITKLDGTVFEKGWIELVQEADGHIRQAAGLDKTLQGQSGSGMGAGSGSDKREAYNIRMATAQRHLRPILQVFDWVMAYNGFVGPNNQRIKTRIVTPFLQTLNNVTPSQRGNTLKQ